MARARKPFKMGDFEIASGLTSVHAKNLRIHLQGLGLLEVEELRHRGLQLLEITLTPLGTEVGELFARAQDILLRASPKEDSRARAIDEVATTLNRERERRERKSSGGPED